MSVMSGLKVLLADPTKSLRATLPPILNTAGVYQIVRADDWKAASEALRVAGAHLVVVDMDGGADDGLAFIREVRARRPEGWNARMPIIALVSQATVGTLHALRDAGVNELLAKPFTTAGVVDRLSRVVLKPRPFVDSSAYFGPERRRRPDPNFRGPYRRRVDGASDLVY